jgi:Flp pilus assembly protein TadD
MICEYRIAADLDPANPLPRCFQGAGFERLSLFSEAERAYQDAIRRAPGFAPAHFALGSLHFKRKRESLAESEFRTALQLDPGLAEAHAGLGQMYDKRGDRAGALREYLEFLRLFQGDPARKAPIRDRVNALQNAP